MTRITSSGTGGTNAVINNTFLDSRFSPDSDVGCYEDQIFKVKTHTHEKEVSRDVTTRQRRPDKPELRIVINLANDKGNERLPHRNINVAMG